MGGGGVGADGVLVLSPAGDTIEVYDDSTLAEALGYEKLPNAGYTQAVQWSEKRAAVISALWTHGRYENRSGQASGLLDTDAQIGLASLPPVLAAPVMRLLVDTDKKAKRTYRIQLVALPERWLSQLPDSEIVETAPPAGGEDDVSTALRSAIDPVAERTHHRGRRRVQD